MAFPAASGDSTWPTIVPSLFFLYGLLGISTAAVRAFTRSRPDSMLRQQVQAWWLIFPVLTAGLWVYPMGSTGLVWLICALAARELSSHWPGPRAPFFGLCGTTFLANQWVNSVLPATSLWHPAGVLVVLVAVGLCRRHCRPLLVGTFVLTLLGVGHLVQIAQLPALGRTGLAWTFYLLALTCLNDIAQFVSGKTLGRHAIAPGISPNKTWQGLAGGVVVSVALSVAIGTRLQLAAPAVLVALGAALALGGFAGDLVFSAIKRVLQLKDFSRLIPGHGGILDRADSLVLTAPLLHALLLTVQLHAGIAP